MSVAATYCKRIGRGVVAAILGVLAVAVLIRAVTALVEGVAVLLLTVILASLVLPGRLGTYWRKLRAELPVWLNTIASNLEQSSARGSSSSTKEEESS